MPRLLQCKKILISIVMLFATTSIQATSYVTYNPISQGLNRLLTNVNPSVHVGIVVQSMETGHIYFAKNANHLFAPASVQKLFTVSAALINLTPNYHFQTRLLSAGKINHGVLQGNLIFQFNGDPSLKQDDIVNLIKQLQTLGIHRIAGSVIIDDTAFDHIPYPAGWLWSDLNSDFAAPLNTVVINRNKFGLSFIPAHRIGEKPLLVPELPPGAATFINEMRTTNYPCGISILSNERNQYLVRGCLPRRSGTQHRTLAIRNTFMFTSSLIRELLREHQIPFNGQILSGKTPIYSQLIAVHSSSSLGKLIVHLLKVSDNLYADTLLKKMGERYQHAPGSWQNGLQAEAPVFADDIGININHLRLIDGAGLSKYNLVTPDDIAELLNYVDHHTILRHTLIPALPIAGVDGTLQWRMPMLARGDRVHAKTGSMTGVSTLAGYVKTRNHGLLSFVIMLNNVPKNRWPCILLENNIVEFLARS